MTTRQERAAATRQHIVDAGLELAEQTGLAGMSVNLIVEKAGVARGRSSTISATARGSWSHCTWNSTTGSSPTSLRRSPGCQPAATGSSRRPPPTYPRPGCLRHRGIRALSARGPGRAAHRQCHPAQRNRQAIRLDPPRTLSPTIPGGPIPPTGPPLVERPPGGRGRPAGTSHGERRPATRNALAKFLQCDQL